MSTDNIKVAIKTRPFIKRELKAGLKPLWSINQDTIFQIDENGHRWGEPYLFDHIFTENATNEEVYSNVVQPLVCSFMQGFNSTIFAYGQTSSGKTHTMMGTDNRQGVIQLAVDDIFDYISEHTDRKYLISCSYFEIYNEKINDLLEPSNIRLKICEDYQGNTFINAKDIVVTCSSQVFEKMKLGNKTRKSGCTNMNERSSRSHTIFRIMIKSKEADLPDGPVQVSQLNLVDLAGSERVSQTKASGTQLKEGACINKSLMVLGHVIRQLSDNEGFINYRDSQLTRLLQSSIGGNAKSLIIATVTTAVSEETKSTLEFAHRAKSIKNKPIVNEILTQEDKIKQYKQLNTKYEERLKKEMEKMKEMENEKALHEQEIERLKQEILMIDTFKSGKQVSMEKPCRRHTVGHYGSVCQSVKHFDATALLADSEPVTSKQSDVHKTNEQYMQVIIEETMNELLADIETSSADVTLREQTGMVSPEAADINEVEQESETEVEVLRTRLKLLEQSYNSLKEYTCLETQCQDDRSRMDQLINENHNLLQDLGKLSLMLKNEKQDKEKMKLEHEQKITAHEVELTFLKQQVKDLSFALEQANCERKTLEVKKNEEINDFKYLLEQQKCNYESQNVYMKNHINKLNMKLSSGNDDILTNLYLLRSVLMEYNDICDVTTQTETSEVDAELNDKMEIINKPKNGIPLLKTEFSNVVVLLESSNNELKKELLLLKDQLQENELCNNNLVEKITSLEHQLKDKEIYQNVAEECQMQLTVLNSQLREKEKHNMELKTQLQELESNNHKEELCLVCDKLKAKELDNNDLKHELKLLKNKLKEKEMHNGKIEEQLSSAEIIIQEKSEECNQSTKALGEYKLVIKNLQELVENSRVKIFKLNSEISELTEVKNEVVILNKLLFLEKEEDILATIKTHENLLHIHTAELAAIDTCNALDPTDRDAIVSQFVAYLLELKDVTVEIDLQKQIDTLLLEIQEGVRIIPFVTKEFCNNFINIGKPKYQECLKKLETVSRYEELHNTNSFQYREKKLQGMIATKRKYLDYLEEKLQKIYYVSDTNNVIKGLENLMAETRGERSEEIEKLNKKISELEDIGKSLRIENSSLKTVINNMNSRLNNVELKEQNSELKEQKINTRSENVLGLELRTRNLISENNRLKELLETTERKKNLSFSPNTSVRVSSHSPQELRKRKRQSVHDERRCIEPETTKECEKCAYGDIIAEDFESLQKELVETEGKLKEVQGFIVELEDREGFLKEKDEKIQKLKQLLERTKKPGVSDCSNCEKWIR